MSDINVGDFVNVTIKGVRQVNHPSADRVRIADEHGDVFDMPAQAAVELAAPATWPPRPGDLWRDKAGRLWFAVESLRSEEREPVLLTCNGKNRRPAVEILDLYSPLTRVHREETKAICRCGEPGRSEDEMYQCEADDCIAHDYLAVGGSLMTGLAPNYPVPSIMPGGGAS